jgi:uncharacterized membrane protein YgcG
MKCPSCRVPLTDASAECPHCGLTLARLDEEFGAIPRHSPFLSDQAGRLGRAADNVRNRLRSFHDLFPQSFFSVFLTNGMTTSISEYTFWLANRGHFGKLDAVGHTNFDLLLGIDFTRKTAALIIGYGLEAYLSERDLDRALAGASAAFEAGDYARGISICVDLISERMKNIVKDLEQDAAFSDEDLI